MPAWRRILDERLLDEVGLPLLHQQHRALVAAEVDDLVRHQGIGDVHHIEGNAAGAPDVGQAEPLQGAQHAVVHAALQDDADVADVARHELVQPALLDELHRGGPALLDLLLLVDVGGGRQDDAAGIAPRRLERVLHAHRRPLVGLGAEAAAHMAGADAHFQHDRRVRRLRQLEAGLDGAHDAFEVRPGIEQPDLGFHGVGVAALLHDRGALAVILADDDQGAAGDAARGQVGQRIRRHVGADRRLEGDGAANGIHDRGGERRRGRRLAGAGLEVHAEVGQDVLRVGQHVHQMRDRRALISRDVAHARLQQGLGDGEDALAVELLPVTEPEVLYLFREGSFGHGRLSRSRSGTGIA